MNKTLFLVPKLNFHKFCISDINKKITSYKRKSFFFVYCFFVITKLVDIVWSHAVAKKL